MTFSPTFVTGVVLLLCVISTPAMVYLFNSTVAIGACILALVWFIVFGIALA